MEDEDWIKEEVRKYSALKRMGLSSKVGMALLVTSFGIVGIVACFPSCVKKRNYCR
jgi:hypothetical protein